MPVVRRNPAPGLRASLALSGSQALERGVPCARRSEIPLTVNGKCRASPASLADTRYRSAASCTARGKLLVRQGSIGQRPPGASRAVATDPDAATAGPESGEQGQRNKAGER